MLFLVASLLVLNGILALALMRARDANAVLRAREREIQRLIEIVKEQNDRLMHLSGRTWTPPPPSVSPPPQEEEKPDTEWVAFS